MFLTIFLIIGLIYLVSNKRYRWLFIIYKTYKRDLKLIIGFLKLNFLIWFYERKSITVAKRFTQLTNKHQNKIAFYFENETWSYQNIEELSNKIAHYFKNNKFNRGDTVALLMESRPEYVCIWLGLSKIGVITAFINTNLIADPLIHCIKVSHCKAIIYGVNFTKNINEIKLKMSDLKFYQFDKNVDNILEGSISLNKEIEEQPIYPLTYELNRGKPQDKLILIYTSGTTGLPKAAVITNIRFCFIALSMKCVTGLRHDDIIYDSLPLYHSAGGILGIGQALLNGITVVIRQKFSALNFWNDCNKYKCTVAQYIGETCRYILAAHQNLVNHSIRTIVGNGLRPQIWKAFVKRFNIKEVYEFYGATEGNSNLINVDSKLGAVGAIPRYAQYFYPINLIKFYKSTGKPIRTSDGLCIPCKINEPGILIGKVIKSKAINSFTGYVDEKATQDKLISNVFKKGDLYFNSGDVLVQDEFGYFFFKDRTGDTFRWKGENVATSEVEGIVSNLINFKDAVVYGVEIPETEGRAGMVAIVDTDNTLDLDSLCKRLKAQLPLYAVPLFVRVTTSVPLTGTFKLKKNDFQKEGFNINIIKDDIYIINNKNHTYDKLTDEIYQNIITGVHRL